MGGASWGGATLPVVTDTMAKAVWGTDANGLFTGEAVWPLHNFKNEVVRLWDDGLNTSPYANVVLHDPNPELDDALSRLEDADTLLQMFDPETNWEDLLDTVKARLDADITWEGDIDAVVDAFDTANIPALQRSKARQAAVICENGGAYGTAFLLSGAMLEKAHNDKVAEYRAQMTLEAKKARASVILQAIAQLLDAIRYRVELNRIMAVTRLEFAKANIMANSDLVANQLKVDVEADKWNINLLSEVKGMNLIQGPPALQRGLDPWQAALSLGLNAVGSLMNAIPGLAGAF